MASDVIVTVTGHTTSPADLRFTPSGAAVANFTVAHTARSFDKQSNEWKDGTTTFYRVNAWRTLGEAAGEALSDKGIKVTVTGRLENREYDKDGQKRTSLEITADEVSVALSGKQTVTVAKGKGGGQQPRGGGNGGQWNGSGGQSPANAWGAPQQPASNGWGGQQ